MGSPEDIWQASGQTGEISEPEFHKYFEGRDTAVAFAVMRTRRFTKPLALADLSPRPAVPQSTIYLIAKVEDRSDPRHCTAEESSQKGIAWWGAAGPTTSRSSLTIGRVI